MSAASFLHSSFLQAVNAVMLWLVRAEKVPQASEHLCPAKLQIRCDICCALLFKFAVYLKGEEQVMVGCWLLNVPATC